MSLDRPQLVHVQVQVLCADLAGAQTHDETFTGQLIQGIALGCQYGWMSHIG